VGSPAEHRIHAAIEDHGPITFAEFMQLALYGPGSFYDSPPVGASGDFVTSPHVHEVFGTMLGRGIRDLWTALGAPDPFRLVEVGAGDGTLARQVLAALEDLPISYTAVEISEGARTSLAEVDGLDVRDEMPSSADLVLAHELLDNLPFRVVRGRREVRIGAADGGRLREVLVEIDDDLASAMPDGAPTEPRDAETGDLVVPVGSFSFVDRLADALDPGIALVIDYGAVGSTGGGVHGYRGHRVIEDVLHAPGTADITSGVDFAAIARRARDAGLVAFGPVSQHDALMALGFERWLRDELARQHEQLDRRDGVEAVRTWSGRSRATLLADPAALGRLRWLVLATPGVAPPPWIGSSG
jgi:NADH dehydrogenase [ubiquinone] 1 alpha subcomplex assembly factor 7